MKKEIIQTWSAILVIVMLVLSLSACNFNSRVNGNHTYHDLFPTGYTGGFHHQPGANIEYWWVETHEECIEAIDLLKSNGSTFVNDTVLTYDGGLFDCKYCFVIKGVGGSEKIKWGEDPFDRRAINVQIITYAFVDDVDLDELNHSLVGNYESYLISSTPAYDMLSDEITSENATISEWTKRGSEHLYKEGYYEINKNVYYGKELIISLGTQFYVEEGTENNLGITDDCIKALIESGKKIILNEN